MTKVGCLINWQTRLSEPRNIDCFCYHQARQNSLHLYESWLCWDLDFLDSFLVDATTAFDALTPDWPLDSWQGIPQDQKTFHLN